MEKERNNIVGARKWLQYVQLPYKNSRDISLFFWVITTRKMGWNRRFVTTYRPIFKGQAVQELRWFETDVSEQLIRPIFKGQAVRTA
jgi:hypothetical protein